MVSALWNACAAEVEDVENVQQLLKDGADLEIKDHTGATALVQAVRNNHKQIVKALVAAGADVTQGKPESYTTDPETLALLRPAQEYPDGGFDPMQHYYYPPPGQEGPYPPYPYPVQPDQFDANAQGMPPPEVARSIPCRYFPGCRYGSSCMFLHPPAPYFAGPPPPHYPHMYPPHPYYMMRYPPPPPPPATDPATSPVTGTQPFPPIYPNGAPPFSPPTNGAPAFPNGAAYPNGAPYPPANGAPYPPTNGTPFSPASTGTPYTPATNGTHSPYGPPPFSPGTATPYSAGAPFTPAGPAPYPYPRTYPDAPKEPVNGTTEEPPAQTNNATTNGHPNGGFRRNTRGGRRESFGARQQQKPPCLFFPSGRCRNGDECRFPHVPLEPGAQPPFRYPPGNGRFNHRPRQSIGHDNPPPAHIPPGTKLPFAPGGGQQRVPNADDFPVLGGDKAPAPSANGANGGLTAAQVLQAPAPAKKKDSDVVDGLADALSKVHVNGLTTPAFEAPSTTPEITAVGA